ncbi:hypothetical protein AMK09_08955 [Streptomyces sp. CB02488]|nr:hypothetical protein AMK09_08955 [Streptomyces sp. CB02488]
MTIALTVSMFFLTSLTVVAALTFRRQLLWRTTSSPAETGTTGELRVRCALCAGLRSPSARWRWCSRSRWKVGRLEGREVTFLAQFAITAAAAAVLPGADFAWFPLESTGLVSVPVGFLTGWAASRTTGSGPRSRAQYWALEERALTESGSAEPPGRVR